MATKEEVLKGLNKVKSRLDDPGTKEKFKDFTKKMQFTFTDLNTNYVMDIVNGEAKSLKEETVEKPDIMVTIKSDIFLAILDKKINPVTSYMTGKIKVKGSMGDLLKLQKIMF
ncbi:MAG: SCP2 sterol-binding domain-containing protein [Candidatus Thermoplasmatota archaeon]|jgi:putative sterol carrier protein|nr:SCP2 sterol-binding domain-containing protein [Candidatus Thermoplasmatota archaeon]